MTGTVFDFERLSGVDTDYTWFDNGLSGGGAEMVWEALSRFDSSVNFADFDADGDGVVDIVAVVHPERGAECGGANFSDMWSHHSYLSRHYGFAFPTNDPAPGGGTMRVDRFMVVPALSCAGGLIEIGIFCHEHGHALGLPDFYDTVSGGVSGDSDGIGVWGLMATGNWKSPLAPAHLTAFAKEQLGWLEYFDVLQDGLLCLPPVETSPIAARVWKDGIYGTEYFLVENRQRIGSDLDLWSPGLVIYHVDEHRYDEMRGANQVNAEEILKSLDVETPDAVGPGHGVDRDDLDVAGDMNRGDRNDVWCVGGFDDVFGPTSNSDSRAMNNTPTGVVVAVRDSCDGDADGWICADYTVGVAQPVDLCLPDCTDGDCGDIARCNDYWASPKHLDRQRGERISQPALSRHREPVLVRGDEPRTRRRLGRRGDALHGRGGDGPRVAGRRLVDGRNDLRSRARRRTDVPGGHRPPLPAPSRAGEPLVPRRRRHASPGPQHRDTGEPLEQRRPGERASSLRARRRERADGERQRAGRVPGTHDAVVEDLSLRRRKPVPEAPELHGARGNAAGLRRRRRPTPLDALDHAAPRAVHPGSRHEGFHPGHRRDGRRRARGVGPRPADALG